VAKAARVLRAKSWLMKYRPTPAFTLIRRFLVSVEKNHLSGAVVRSYRRLVRSVKNHGPGGTLKRAFIQSPQAAGQEPLRPLSPHPFDLRHDTDTGGRISAANLSALTLSSLYTTVYLAIPPSTLQPALAALPIKYEDFTFVDAGCGKGRALLIASQFPFRHLIGVEISPELCRVAQANLAHDPSWNDRIVIVNRDVIDFQYPQGPLLLFIYNPFLTNILARVLKNLKRHLRYSPRPVYLLFADLYAKDSDVLRNINPRYRQLMNSSQFLREISDKTYPLSLEDAAAEPRGNRTIRMLLYSAGVMPSAS
jgi:SAM-dependent methyltransferase